MIDGFIDFELGVGFQEFEDSSFRIVARSPRAIGEHIGGHVFDDSIEDTAVTSGTC